MRQEIHNFRPEMFQEGNLSFRKELNNFRKKNTSFQERNTSSVEKNNGLEGLAVIKITVISKRRVQIELLPPWK